MNVTATTSDPAGRRLSPQQVCRAVREDIIHGVFPPGERLTEESLAERYGVSRVPVREALRTLDAEGFVVTQPYVGSFVAELTEEEAADLLAVRSMLEPLCAERAARRRTQEHLGQLRKLLSLGKRAAKDGRLGELAKLNRHFHEAVAEASGSGTLSGLVRQVGRKIAWVYAVEPPSRAKASWAEHEEIYTAIEAGDPERARAAVERHLAGAEKILRFHDGGPPA